MKAAIMKAAAIAALIAAAAISAHAQDQADQAANSAKVKDSSKPEARKPAAAAGTTALNTNTTAPITTSTASLPSAVQTAAPRKVFGEFYSETFIAMTDFEHGEGKAKLTNFGGVRFDLGNTNSLSIRQNFDYISAEGAGAGDFKMQDTALIFTRGKLAEFKNGPTLTLQGRFYAPTGENSRNVGQNAQERLYLIAAKSIGKFDLSYVIVGSLFQQSRDYNIADESKADPKDRYAQTMSAALTNELDVFYNINSKLALGVALGMDNIAFNNAPGLSTSADDVYIQPTLQVAPLKGLTLQALLYNELNIRNPEHEQRLFRGQETKVSFNVAAQL